MFTGSNPVRLLKRSRLDRAVAEKPGLGHQRVRPNGCLRLPASLGITAPGLPTTTARRSSNRMECLPLGRLQVQVAQK